MTFKFPSLAVQQQISSDFLKNSETDKLVLSESQKKQKQIINELLLKSMAWTTQPDNSKLIEEHEESIKKLDKWINSLSEFLKNSGETEENKERIKEEKELVIKLKKEKDALLRLVESFTTDKSHVHNMDMDEEQKALFYAGRLLSLQKEIEDSYTGLGNKILSIVKTNTAEADVMHIAINTILGNTTENVLDEAAKKKALTFYQMMSSINQNVAKLKNVATPVEKHVRLPRGLGYGNSTSPNLLRASPQFIQEVKDNKAKPKVQNELENQLGQYTTEDEMGRFNRSNFIINKKGETVKTYKNKKGETVKIGSPKTSYTLMNSRLRGEIAGFSKSTLHIMPKEHPDYANHETKPEDRMPYVMTEKQYKEVKLPAARMLPEELGEWKKEKNTQKVLNGWKGGYKEEDVEKVKSTWKSVSYSDVELVHFPNFIKPDEIGNSQKSEIELSQLKYEQIVLKEKTRAAIEMFKLDTLRKTENREVLIDNDNNKRLSLK